MSVQVVAEDDFIVVAGAMEMDVKHPVGISLECVALVETHAGLGIGHTDVASGLHHSLDALAVGRWSDFDKDVDYRFGINAHNCRAAYMIDYGIVFSEQSREMCNLFFCPIGPLGLMRSKNDGE